MIKETCSNPGLGLVALIPIACCIGLPLIAAAGISVAAAAWAGGIALAVLVLIAVVVLLVLRARRGLRTTRQTFIPRSRS